MCFTVYIATNKVLPLGSFVPEETDIFLEQLTEEEERSLRPKFSKPNIYHVGSDTGCSCGLSFDSNLFDDPEYEKEKKSPARFIELLKELTATEEVEYYCCWFGDWALPVEQSREIDIRQISLDKNYFDLTEKEFIKFTSQFVITR